MPESRTDVGEPIEILMVDDSMGDVRLAQEALKEARVGNRLSVVHDGEQAMAFLRKEDGYGDAPRPDLVLLDLNMPRMDGREVLAQIKGDPDLRSIPVVVLTTSEAEADIVKAYDLHANAYITKPVDLEAFLDAVRVVEEFWLTVVRLPRR
jgi:two-component system, chemotaxis family, response regulator Rcp1